MTKTNFNYKSILNSQGSLSNLTCNTKQSGTNYKIFPQVSTGISNETKELLNEDSKKYYDKCSDVEKILYLCLLSDKAPFKAYELTKGYRPKEIPEISEKDSQLYNDTSILAHIEGEEYENANKALYGEKSNFVKEKLKAFKSKYPDYELKVDNDVTDEKMEEIITATEKYIELQKKANLPHSREILFTKMNECGGFYEKLVSPERIAINIDCNSTEKMLLVLLHENAHYRDEIDGGRNTDKVPDDIAPILQKLLRPYAVANNEEAIAVLTEAIEMPNDFDSNNMTKQIHVRRDDKYNYYLMLDEDAVLTPEEFQKITEYYQSIECPPIIPDYNPFIHTGNYREAIIRKGY